MLQTVTSDEKCVKYYCKQIRSHKVQTKRSLTPQGEERTLDTESPPIFHVPDVTAFLQFTAYYYRILQRFTYQILFEMIPRAQTASSTTFGT